jgi:Ohr subfamily peroxiredoxin
MCYGQSVFHKSHGERRPSRFDPQRRRSARPQARSAPGPWRKGDATNPEQLFAGGYAACFENALLHVSRDAGHRFADGDIGIAARIDLGRNETGGFVLAAALAVGIAGIDRQTAERLVRGAHAICPYSNAIRGNVDVAIFVSVR